MNCIFCKAELTDTPDGTILHPNEGCASWRLLLECAGPQRLYENFRLVCLAASEGRRVERESWDKFHTEITRRILRLEQQMAQTAGNPSNVEVPTCQYCGLELLPTVENGNLHWEHPLLNRVSCERRRSNRLPECPHCGVYLVPRASFNRRTTWEHPSPQCPGWIERFHQLAEEQEQRLAKERQHGPGTRRTEDGTETPDS